MWCDIRHSLTKAWFKAANAHSASLTYVGQLRRILCPARMVRVETDLEAQRRRAEEAERALMGHREEHGC
jgi:hypothetical protein